MGLSTIATGALNGASNERKRGLERRALTFPPWAAPPEHRGLSISRKRVWMNTHGALHTQKGDSSRAEKGLSMSRKRALDETKRGSHIFALGFAGAADHRDRRRGLLLSIVV